jgi:uncharacterized protein (TIGR00106 family)
MIIAEFSVFPVGKGESLSPYVARVLRIVRRSGLPSRLNPMGTVVEGEWDEVFGLIRKCARELQRDCARISLNVKADIRKGKAPRMAHKVEAVEALLAAGTARRPRRRSRDHG